MYDLVLERPEDAGPITDLLDASFGAHRLRKSSYRYRDGVAPIAGLCMVARSRSGLGHGAILGSIRYWPIAVGPTRRPALLLGPLAVDAAQRGSGIGAALMRTTLDMAAWARHELVMLVGDLAYYGRFGFAPASELGVAMAGEAPERVLALPLVRPAAGHCGLVQPVGRPETRRAPRPAAARSVERAA